MTPWSFLPLFVSLVVSASAKSSFDGDCGIAGGQTSFLHFRNVTFPEVCGHWSLQVRFLQLRATPVLKVYVFNGQFAPV